VTARRLASPTCLVVFAAAALAAGCEDSDYEGIIPPDGRPADTAVAQDALSPRPDRPIADGPAPGDAGSTDTRPPDATGSSGIGIACARTSCADSQGDCPDGLRCIPAICDGDPNPPWTGGYCSKDCESNGMPNQGACPNDSACTSLDDNAMTLRCLVKCMRDSDCRGGEAYSCQYDAFSGWYLCRPSIACAVAGPVPPAGFSSNQFVPAVATSAIESEGNIATDGMGNVVISSISIGSQGSAMGATHCTLQGTTCDFSTPVAVSSWADHSDPVVTFDPVTREAFYTWLDIADRGPPADRPLPGGHVADVAV
jgi:hypothetical protein